jgi:glycosyltransferase involved in cell wall biosynthesis
MITYGHERFIQKSIEGVLMQKCNFDIELIISNDCSPDSTDDIVNEIINSHENKSWIKYTRHSTNMGAAGNSIWTLKQAKGKYVAICDGDDYWTDPLKLQKQVDIFEKDKSIGLVHTDYEKYYQETSEKSINSIGLKKIPEGEIYNDLFKSNLIATLTTVIRKDALDEAVIKLETQLSKWSLGDYPLWLFISTRYKIAYLPNVTATYRILSESASNTKNKVKKIKFYLNVLKIQLYFNRNIKSVKFKIFHAYFSFIYSSIKIIIKKN